VKPPRASDPRQLLSVANGGCSAFRLPGGRRERALDSGAAHLRVTIWLGDNRRVADPGTAHDLARDLARAVGTRTKGDPYSPVRGRHAVDYVLRNTHQQLVAVSQQADLKANISPLASRAMRALLHARAGRGGQGAGRVGGGPLRR